MAATLKYTLAINSSYNVTLLVPAILTSGYSNALLTAILNYSTAQRISDVTALHAAALPQLPNGTPTDPKSLIYLLFITTTGEEVVLAQDWLASAPTLVTASQATVVISNISTSDVPNIADILTANGYTSFTITTS